jgi:hypothetical protein
MKHTSLSKESLPPGPSWGQAPAAAAKRACGRDTHSAAGIPPARLQPGDRVQVGERAMVFTVVETLPCQSLVRLRSFQGSELRVGWRALRWA